MKWLSIPYVDYGRDLSGLDCWGLVRLVRQEIRGELLASFGAVMPDNKALLTKILGPFFASQKIDKIPLSDIRPGSIASVWRGRLCLHFGIVIEVDGRLAVLETNKDTGPRWMRVADFNRTYLNVIYYDGPN
jgi:hypothetical protein